MKILLANSPFGGGGVTTFATQLVSCLSADTELVVVLGDDEKAPITDPRVKVIYHDTMSLTVGNALYFIDLINNEIRPDVLIVSTAVIIPAIIPYLNDDITVMTVSHSGRYFFSEYCAVNHNYTDRIIAASSSYNKRYIEQRFHIKDEEKIKVIYNFVGDDKEFEDLRFEKPNQNPISIVYAGATSVHKSPELVAKVVSGLLKTDLDFRFYWTGNTTVPLTTNIMKYSKFKDVRQLFPEDPRLIFSGRIPSKKEYDLLLGSANIFLAPSINEGCSMATLEAHRAGCLMMVADYENSNREIVETGKSGFVINHKNAEDFVSKIIDVIKDHSSYLNYYERSHNTFAKLLSYPVWKEKIFETLKCEKNHKRRKKKISKLHIRMDILYIKWLEISGIIRQVFQISLPSYLSFRKQYRKIKKEKNAKK